MTGENLFELLQVKSIFDIFDGDSKFGEIESNEPRGNIKISMPYLSGPALCEISTRFGLVATYGSGSQSRWMYLNDLWSYCVKNHRESDLLSFLFSKEQFCEKLNGYRTETIENSYLKIKEKIIEKINEILYFGGNELVRVGDGFMVQKINSFACVATPKIKTIDREYIISISGRSFKDISDKNYDSAITKSRTLLEEVFCYVIEKKGEVPSENGKIRVLYNQVKQLYDMHQDKVIDKRINQLLSGLESIILAISDMRNNNSDSHGIGFKRIKIAEHHARLFVNSAMTVSEFVLAVGSRETP